MTLLNARVRSTVHSCHEGEVIQINDGPGYSEPVYTIDWDSGNLSYVSADAFEVIDE